MTRVGGVLMLVPKDILSILDIFEAGDMGCAAYLGSNGFIFISNSPEFELS
jgi:hypothetical protein